MRVCDMQGQSFRWKRKLRFVSHWQTHKNINKQTAQTNRKNQPVYFASKPLWHDDMTISNGTQWCEAEPRTGVTMMPFDIGIFLYSIHLFVCSILRFPSIYAVADAFWLHHMLSDSFECLHIHVLCNATTRICGVSSTLTVATNVKWTHKVKEK